jgi:hypothetical protein
MVNKPSLETTCFDVFEPWVLAVQGGELIESVKRQGQRISLPKLISEAPSETRHSGNRTGADTGDDTDREMKVCLDAIYE